MDDGDGDGDGDVPTATTGSYTADGRQTMRIALR